uniref:Tripartite motif containing 35 n=1 Tax=Cairina moschata TaxID=8855 RepID=A0A8C3BI76_CAIMO
MGLSILLGGSEWGSTSSWGGRNGAEHPLGGGRMGLSTLLGGAQHPKDRQWHPDGVPRLLLLGGGAAQIPPPENPGRCRAQARFWGTSLHFGHLDERRDPTPAQPGRGLLFSFIFFFSGGVAAIHPGGVFPSPRAVGGRQQVRGGGGGERHRRRRAHEGADGAQQQGAPSPAAPPAGDQAEEGGGRRRRRRRRRRKARGGVHAGMKPVAGALQEAVQLAQEKEKELAARQEACNETMLALWEQCKPCLKHTCMRFYSRTCHSGSGLVGRQLEEQIKKEFEKLHEFLRDEQKALLSQLQEEARHKRGLVEGKIKQLSDESRALLNEARQLQDDLKEDDYTFLMTHKNRKRRIACTVEEPEAVASGMLIDTAKYLGSLQYNVWKKMLDNITVVPFSFDPNSAAGWLSVSEDLTSVTNGGYKLLTENPERFTSAPCILGSRGFSAGFHSWEVDLGGLTNWRVGVARPRGRTPWNFHHDARSGFWYLYRLPTDGETCRASNAARSEATPGELGRLRVELDCDEGELSFYDADRKTHIYTFHEKFGGTVFPYFYVGATPVGALPRALRICPVRVRVHEDAPV